VLPLGVRTFLGLGNIMQWGNEGLVGMGEEVVPTLDLSRILLNARVQRTLYTSDPIATINGTVDTTFQYNDASDWAEIQVNGVVQVADSALPPPDHERILIGAAGFVSGIVYVSAELTRTMPVAATVRQSVVEFGAITGSHVSPSIIAPYLLPVTLNLEELDLRLRIVGTDTTSTFTLVLELLSAERGIMNLFPGV